MAHDEHREHQEHEKKHAAKEKKKLELGRTARISIEQAIQTAKQQVSGKVIEAELEEEHGKRVWEVEIMTSDQDRVGGAEVVDPLMHSQSDQIEGRGRGAGRRSG